MPPCLVIHGGAWNVPDGDVEEILEGLRGVLAPAWGRLRDGAPAVDVVEAAVRLLEDHPAFNAGRGAHLNSAGRVELDASIMEGATLDAGAVAAIQEVRHPVSVARRVMEASPHVMLVGAGAGEFARRHGLETCSTEELLVGRELERFRRVRDGDTTLVDREFHAGPGHLGTVGAVACDTAGHVAAATSTGGTQDKSPGRVGDSPVIGAGTYADDRAGAVSCTGHGEAILRVTLARHVVDRLAAGRTPEEAGADALDALARVQGRGGLILVDRQGRGGAAYNTPRMARGIADSTAVRMALGENWIPT